MLREHITAPSSEASPSPIDLVLHIGGQAWMGDAFENAQELLRRRAMEPLLCAEGGWREAQEEAVECLREVTNGREKFIMALDHSRKYPLRIIAYAECVDCGCTLYDRGDSFGRLGSSSGSKALLLCLTAVLYTGNPSGMLPCAVILMLAMDCMD